MSDLTEDTLNTVAAAIAHKFRNLPGCEAVNLNDVTGIVVDAWMAADGTLPLWAFQLCSECGHVHEPSGAPCGEGQSELASEAEQSCTCRSTEREDFPPA